MNQKLYRSHSDRMLGGVCGGIAQYTNMDANIIRVIALLLFFTGIGPLAYLAAWIIIPEDPSYQSRSYHHVDNNELNHEVQHGNNTDNQQVFGWILLFLGAYALADRIFPINLRSFFWPVALILVGFYFLAKHNSSHI